MASLSLIPDIVSARAVEMEQGVEIPDSGLNRLLEQVSDPDILSAPSTKNVTVPIIHRHDDIATPLGSFELNFSLEEVEQDTGQQLTRAITASLIAATALVLGSFIVLHFLVLKPVMAVARSSRSSASSIADIADDGFEPINWNTKDQLGELVGDYNTLRQSQREHAIALLREQEALKARTVELQKMTELASEARDTAIHANQAKSRFLATMTHELRTPLNSIIGLADVLKQNQGRLSEEKTTKSLERIGSSGRHLLNLINEILDLSKMEAGKLSISTENTDLVASAREASDLSETQIQENQNELVLEDRKTALNVKADPVRLKQIFLNILSNAAKFTKEGSIEITFLENVPKGMHSIAVRDTGIGMTGEQMSRLFQDFEQAEANTDRHYGGTGLGLSISRRLARAMGGDIAVASIMGEGSTFTLNLPAASEDETPKDKTDE